MIIIIIIIEGITLKMCVAFHYLKMYDLKL